MRALNIRGRGGPEVLELTDVPEPALGAWEVRVRVRASALNRADLLQCLGLYPPPHGVPETIPGLEYAGEVLEVGAQVRRFKPQDRVMGLVGGGAFAEQLVVHEREAVRMPAGMSFNDAAALPEALITAHDALVTQGGAGAGDVVLVHAVASGVGSAAAQLMNAIGATVVGTSRSAEKLERMKALGVHHPLHVASEPPAFAAQVKALTGGADVALELVGGAYVRETIEAMRVKGRILLVGMLGGASSELPLGRVLQKRLQLQGTVLRSRPLEEKIAAAQAFEHAVVPLVEAGRIRPLVDATLPFTEARAAFARLTANATLGKVVLSW